MIYDIAVIQAHCWQTAEEHGWHAPLPDFGTAIALMHSELSEALEESRNGHALQDLYHAGAKPEGVAAELADVLIRIFDYAAAADIPLLAALEQKMDYNRSRPHRHGKAF